MNSNKKGKRGELELAHFLTRQGFPARRGQQYSGSPDSPDVVCESLEFHIECKRVEALSLYPAMDQAQKDSGGLPAVVFHRRNNKQWLAILPAADFLKAIK